MFGRGSPRINLMKAVAVQRKPSPKISSTQKREPSPKVDHSRACWNVGLEKALIDLLHEHNNECYRGHNGWSTEAWNKIVKLFHEKFPYVNFTKVQIQDKDRELKREYKVLKEARKQSGAHWNEKLCRIEGDEAVWNNIITSHPKAKRFRNKSFPLFESLGELYDGQTAEGTLNFTSIAPSQVPVTQPYQGGITQPSSQIPVTQPSQGGITHTQPSSKVPVTQPYEGTITHPFFQVPVTHPYQDATTQPSQSDMTQANYIGEETEKGPFDPSGHAMDDDDEVRIVDQPTTTTTIITKSLSLKQVGVG
ncbi:uncharacterized protein [Miscanthus floridulus]|uniref:uncharacterized protein n=1 Tax=Miscanthus floridulus TaxID=154761 RepID=UPI003457F582